MNAEQKIIKKFADECLATIKAGEGLAFREDEVVLESLPMIRSLLEEVEAYVTDWCLAGIRSVMQDRGIDWEEEE